MEINNEVVMWCVMICLAVVCVIQHITIREMHYMNINFSAQCEKMTKEYAIAVKELTFLRLLLKEESNKKLDEMYQRYRKDADDRMMDNLEGGKYGK